jgi:hypothetical protein
VEANKDSDYINKQFRSAINESPQLAWALPDGTIAAQSQSPNIFIYSAAPVVEKVARRVTLSPEKTLELTRRNHIACDAPLYEKPPSFSLYNSALKGFNGNPQMLHTNRPLPGVIAGQRRSQLEDAMAKEVWKKMQPKSPQQPRNAMVIRRDGVEYFYTLAALYGGAQSEVSRTGMFLQTNDGRVIASNIEDVTGWCDGCAVPTFADGIEQVYAVENMFTAPQFSYPLLMLDTSTVEGRSITLATFSPDKKYSDFLLYEYTVGCN